MSKIKRPDVGEAVFLLVSVVMTVLVMSGCTVYSTEVVGESCVFGVNESTDGEIFLRDTVPDSVLSTYSSVTLFPHPDGVDLPRTVVRG